MCSPWFSYIFNSESKLMTHCLLGGGFSLFVWLFLGDFLTKNWGRWSHIDGRMFFLNVMVQPPPQKPPRSALIRVSLGWAAELCGGETQRKTTGETVMFWVRKSHHSMGLMMASIEWVGFSWMCGWFWWNKKPFQRTGFHISKKTEKSRPLWMIGIRDSFSHFFGVSFWYRFSAKFFRKT